MSTNTPQYRLRHGQTIIPLSETNLSDARDALKKAATTEFRSSVHNTVLEYCSEGRRWLVMDKYSSSDDEALYESY